MKRRAWLGIMIAPFLAGVHVRTEMSALHRAVSRSMWEGLYPARQQWFRLEEKINGG